MKLSLKYVNNLYYITGLTGGGPSNLDGVATAAGESPLYSVVQVIISGAAKRFQLLLSSLTPGPGIINPVDRSTSNLVQWIEID